MREEKKAEKRQELVGVCLDCFVEKGLTLATTKNLCKAAKLQNGGIYYYFSTKEEIVLACAEEAISRIEKAAFAIVLEDISDIKSMMDHLGELADKMSPTMRFLVSVCVSREYGEKVKPSLVRLGWRNMQPNRDLPICFIILYSETFEACEIPVPPYRSYSVLHGRSAWHLQAK